MLGTEKVAHRKGGLMEFPTFQSVGTKTPGQEVLGFVGKSQGLLGPQEAGQSRERSKD